MSGPPESIPGYVAHALHAVGVTAWEIDVGSGEIRQCGALGGVAGRRDDLGVLREQIHPDDSAGVTAAFDVLVSGAVEEQDLEYRWGNDDDGVWTWYEVRYRAASRDAGGRALRVIGVSCDVSRRKMIEVAFGAIEARLRSYIAHGGMAVWCLEPEAPVPVAISVELQVELLMAARLVDCNDAFLAGRGMTRAEAMGCTMEQLATVPGQLRAVVARMVGSFYQHEEEDFVGVTPEGLRRYLTVRVKPVIEDGHVVRLWGSTTDRTAQVLAERQREALERQLEQARRLESVGALAGGVAHDFNNLLAAIQGSVELAAATLPANTPVAEDLAVIREATERAADLTRRLLTFSRRHPARREPFTAAEVIHGVTPMLRRLLPASMQIELAVADALPTLVGDASALEQALINLVVNARDATRGAGRLRIAAEAVTLDDAACRDRPWARPGAYVNISVADDGAGIPAEHLGRIFDPFFTTKPVDQGTGLGLAIVYGTVVRQHDGLVDVASGPTGTCFSLYLPRPAVPQAEPILHPPPAALVSGQLVEQVRAVAGRPDGHRYPAASRRAGISADTASVDRGDEIPGYVASALVAMRITAWELDVAAGMVKRCGAMGGAEGDLATLASFHDDVHPDDRAGVAAAMIACIGGAVDEQYVEYRWRGPDGAWIWVEGNYRASDRDASGRALRVLGVSRDISRRHALEDVLRQVEARLRSYISHGGAPVWCLEPETKVSLSWSRDTQVDQLLAARLVDCNDAFLQLRRLSRDQVMGRTMESLESVAGQMRQAVSRLVDSGYQHDHEDFEGVDANGGTRYLTVRVKPVIELGEVVRLWGSLADRTPQVLADRQREALEQQLQQAQRLESIGALAGGVAHDFNNLLVAIQGSVELATSTLPADSPVAEDLAAIRDATERAAELTRRLLTFSRRQPARREPFTAAAVIHGVAPMLRRLLPSSMKIELAVAGELPALLGDASAIEQALVNLAVNARDATRGVGRIRIAADAVTLDEAACRDRVWARPGTYVRISVADDGAGIPPEHLDRIFDPFFSTKPVGQGTGLGLAIVYGTVVRQHDGLVEVTSSPAGTCFTLYLPRPAAAEPSAITARIPTVDTGRERLLLAEDEAAVRRITVSLLERSGYRVVAVADGAAAVAAFEHDPDGFDLVVLDAIMPALRGREVFDRIQVLRPDQRVLFVSGYTDGELEGVPIDQRRRWFLAKPWNKSELLRAVRTAIDTV